jgi:hypothetical protein
MFSSLLLPIVFSKCVPGLAWQPMVVYAVFPVIAVSPTNEYEPNASPRNRLLVDAPSAREASEIGRARASAVEIAADTVALMLRRMVTTSS